MDSEDEFGEAAQAFNNLIHGLSTSHQISDGISSVSRALAAHLDLDALAEEALRELELRTGSDAAALLVVRKGRLEVAGSLGLHDASELISSEAIRSAVSSGEATYLDLPAEVVISGGLVDFVPQEVRIDPIRFGVVTIGVLVMAYSHRSSKEADAVVSSALPSIAVAVNNALNHEDLQRVAALDQLTGIYNRRFGMQRITEEYGRSIRSGDPLGLLLFDLDHFKSINDTYGHLTGDHVLESVVSTVKGVLREGDVLMRYGGEEFVVALPGAGRDDVLKMAERVRRAVSDLEIQEGGQRIRVTISVGGAGLPNSKAGEAADLIGLADEALYTAKESGRDRSVIV